MFLYNSELWISTKTICEKIDSFQRRLLRKVLNVKWPRIVKNEVLYEITKVTRWSKIIKKRRLSWLGHLLRLDAQTPARIALKEACRIVKKRPGRKNSWIETIKNDLKNSNLNLNINNNETFFNNLEIICKDRKRWKSEMRYMML